MFKEKSVGKPGKSQMQMSMYDKREEYRAELRRIHNKARRKLMRRDLINTNILNNFQEVQDILEQLIRQDRIQELQHRISILSKELKEFEGEIFPHEVKLMDMLAKLVWVNHRNTIKEEENKQWQEEKMEEQRNHLLLKRLVDPLTEEIVILLSNQYLCYGQFTLNRLRSITNWLWGLFDSSDANDIRMLLIILSHILIDKESYFQVLKEKGLTTKICSIINKNDESVRKTYPQILDLLINYIRIEARIEQSKQVQDITAQMLNNEDRNYMLSFAISMIGIRNSELCQKGLELIRELTEMNNYLCEFVNEQTIRQMVDLIRSNDLEICRTALEVIDNLIYFTKNSCSEYVLDCGILEQLEQLIDREEKSPDNYQHARLTKITHIICNLMACPLAKRRRQVKTHPIMNRIYRCVYPDSRLLVLGKVFEYFFFASDINTVSPIIDALLQSISQLQLRDQSRPEHQIYKDIILLLTREAMTYWKEYDQIVQMMQRYNLYWIVQESI